MKLNPIPAFPCIFSQVAMWCAHPLHKLKKRPHFARYIFKTLLDSGGGKGDLYQIIAVQSFLEVLAMPEFSHLTDFCHDIEGDTKAARALNAGTRGGERKGTRRSD